MSVLKAIYLYIMVQLIETVSQCRTRQVVLHKTTVTGREHIFYLPPVSITKYIFLILSCYREHLTMTCKPSHRPLFRHTWTGSKNRHPAGRGCMLSYCGNICVRPVTLWIIWTSQIILLETSLAHATIGCIICC